MENELIPILKLKDMNVSMLTFLKAAIKKLPILSEFFLERERLLSERDKLHSELADLTEGYSGRDISVVCREAAMEPIRSLQKTGVFEKEERIESLPPVTREDFLSAIENIRPATSPEDVKKYLDWAEGS